MRTFLVLMVAAGMLAAPACGGSVGGDRANSGPAGSGGATSTAGTTTSGVGGGKTCGGKRGATCATDEYCDFPDDSCGADDASGVCTPRPTECAHSHQPICGCDGVVHDNACEAGRAGVDGNALGGCAAPAGTFACGPLFCRVDQEFCLENAEPPASYGCQSLPAACGSDPSCSCLEGVTCGNCTTTPDGGLLAACAAG